MGVSRKTEGGIRAHLNGGSWGELCAEVCPGLGNEALGGYRGLRGPPSLGGQRGSGWGLPGVGAP